MCLACVLLVHSVSGVPLVAVGFVSLPPWRFYPVSFHKCASWVRCCLSDCWRPSSALRFLAAFSASFLLGLSLLLFCLLFLLRLYSSSSSAALSLLCVVVYSNHWSPFFGHCFVITLFILPLASPFRSFLLRSVSTGSPVLLSYTFP